MSHTHDTSVLHQLALFPGTLGHPIIPLSPNPPFSICFHSNLSTLMLMATHHTSNSSVMTQQKTAALFLTLAKNYYLSLMEQVHAEVITHNQAATTSPVVTKSANYKHTERNNNDRRTHVDQIVTNTPLLLPPIAASPPTYPLLHMLDKPPWRPIWWKHCWRQSGFWQSTIHCQ